MPKFEAIRTNLPLLFRPEPGDTTLLPTFMQSAGALLDDLSSNLGAVMQAHWSGFADDAKFNAYLGLVRQLEGQAPLNTSVEADRLVWERFPYLRDLARIGALLALPPYRDPVALREAVEAYRRRLKRHVRLYRNGLGTVEALRAAVEMELPADPALPAPQRERSFSIEEYAPLRAVTAGFESRRGASDQKSDEVGPLMRWSFQNDGLEAAPATLYIQGLSPEEGVRDPTLNPTVECYQTADGRRPLAIAYNGLIAPGETLRLCPAFASWLGTDSGLLQATAVPGPAASADPTAPGPWAAVPGAPAAEVTALYQSYDRVLWLAAAVGGAGELWRFDGAAWLRVLETTPLGIVHCMAELDDDLCIGTADGLLRMPLYPNEGEPFSAAAHAQLAGTAVYAMLGDPAGFFWLGAHNGVSQLHPDDTLSAVADLPETPIYALCRDPHGVFYFGGELGLFQYQPGSGRWAWYRGEFESDQFSEWEPLTPGVLPSAAEVFLPPVHAVHVSLDASVWIGTAAGFARYHARRERGAYKTMLAAYPDLAAGPVSAIREDARGLVWIVTDRGLLRYDGRDLAQHQAAANAWVPMGRADQMYDDDAVQDRGAWRYNRSGTPSWQQFDGFLDQWRSYTIAPRSSDEAAVRALLWSDALHAELGTLEGEAESFTPHEAGHPGSEAFVMRVKPSEDRIVAGGLAAVPRMPRGESTWRYLSLETPGMSISANRPWWSCEGRLFEEAPRSAPFPGRHTVAFPTASNDWFGEVVFAYKPAAKLWLSWAPRQLLTTLVRLHKRSDDESIPPAILDRVWQGIQRVRPAGVRTMLAVERDIVRGGVI